MLRLARTTLAACLVLLALNAPAHAQSDLITYQGTLDDAGGFANGVYDMRFAVFTAPTGGTALATDELAAVQVADGLFSVELDFESVLSFGFERYLEISIKPEGAPTYTTLTPRVRLTAAPAAIVADHAEIADYALDGPFAPRDTTPASNDGVLQMQVTTTVNIDGDVYANMEIQYPIRIHRDIIEQNGTLFPANYDDFTIRLRTPLAANSMLRDRFYDAQGNVSVTITCDSPLNNQTVYTFTHGVISAHRFAQDRSIDEVLEITFAQTFNPAPLSNFADRDASGYDGFGHAPFAPYLGGDAVLPGAYKFVYDRNPQQHASVGQLPDEMMSLANGFPTGVVDAAEVELILNTYDDQRNDLWNEFADSFPQLKTLTLEDSTGNTVWQPRASGPNALIGTWELRQADDGGLFEVYGFTYLANQFNP